jgi:hypothetical protein
MLKKSNSQFQSSNKPNSRCRDAVFPPVPVPELELLEFTLELELFTAKRLAPTIPDTQFQFQYQKNP